MKTLITYLKTPQTAIQKQRLQSFDTVEHDHKISIQITKEHTKEFLQVTKIHHKLGSLGNGKTIHTGSSKFGR